MGARTRFIRRCTWRLATSGGSRTDTRESRSRPATRCRSRRARLPRRSSALNAANFPPRRFVPTCAAGADMRACAARNIERTPMRQPNLFEAPATTPAIVEPPPVDQAARDFAIDPSQHVVLEASAGTGKTRVLVDRYVRLIERGVEPRNILAVTFTRKAAAEMRDRIFAALKERAASSPPFAARWTALADRLSEIEVSTIDAFCFSLLREFPLEADVDPAFEVADETEMARFANEALDVTWRKARGLIASHEAVRLLFAKLRVPSLRDALANCLDRRQVALPAVATFIDRYVRCRSSEEAAARFVAAVRDAIVRSPHADALINDGPSDAGEYRWLRADLQALNDFPVGDTGRVHQLEHRVGRYFLTDDGEPRVRGAAQRFKSAFASPAAKKRHDASVKAVAPDIHDALAHLAADVNGLLARGLQHVLLMAVKEYERLLDEHALLDFA